MHDRHYDRAAQLVKTPPEKLSERDKEALQVMVLRGMKAERAGYNVEVSSYLEALVLRR